MWIYNNRQPFRLKSEIDMPAGIKPDPASNSERKTRKAVCASGDVGGPQTRHDEGLRPFTQILQ